MASSHNGTKDGLYKELWMACAGPLVDVPNKGKSVFYFPQGHIKQLQVEDSTSQEQIGQQIPKVNLPNKMLCSVVHSSLKVDRETDEVYAIIKLHPFQEAFETAYDNHPPSKQPNPTIRSFYKILTTSDTNRHGALSVPRKHANRCLPPLDLSQQTLSQELIAKDLHGNQWRFRHIIRGMPRRHIITGGWGKFVSSKRLVAGDALIFMRGPNDELRIGIRRLGQQIPTTSSILSSQNMHLRVLASASHALCKNTEFVVYYNPRACPFIVGQNKYLKADAYNFSTGMHVVMPFKGGEDPENEKRYTGVIMEETDLSSEWPGSEWMSLKVQWNEPSESVIEIPERVSPWQLEPIEDAWSNAGSFEEAASSSKSKRSQICGKFARL